MELAIGLIIGLVIGSGAIYFWQNSRIAQKDKEIKQANRKVNELEQDYESRMQQSITSLQKDYEDQSRQKIEAFKKQYNSKIQELQQSHQAQIQQIKSLEGSQENLSKVQQDYDRQIEESNRKIREYEEQIQQLTESISLQERVKPTTEDSVKIAEPEEEYLLAQEQLSEEAMEELMQLLDDTPHRK
jgi:chromosome segregation ATPase